MKFLSKKFLCRILPTLVWVVLLTPHVVFAGAGTFLGIEWSKYIPDGLIGAASSDLGVLKNFWNYTPSLLKPFALILYFAGYFMDYAIGLSIFGEIGGNSIYSAGIIQVSWTIFRDLVNIIFIFIIIYIGIATILGVLSSGMKQLLVRVIIVALLVNFSLVLTGVIIDAGNIMALKFYESFPERSGLFALLSPDANSLSYPFIKATQIDRFLDTNAFARVIAYWSTDAGLFTALGPIDGIIFIGGSVILHIMATFAMITVGILFVVRTAVLWLLLIVSPLAFGAAILPKTERHFNKWFHVLLKNVFFAPAFLVLFFVTTEIYNSAEFTLLFTNDESFMTLILAFVVVLVLMFSSIVLSKQMGVIGASTVVGWTQRKTKRAGAFVGRNTLGRGAQRLEDKYGNKLRERAPQASRMVLAPLQEVASAKFGGKKGFKKTEEDTTKRIMKERAKMSPEERKEYDRRLKLPFASHEEKYKDTIANIHSDEINRINNDSSLSPNERDELLRRAHDRASTKRERGTLLNRLARDNKTVNELEKTQKKEEKKEGARKAIAEAQEDSLSILTNHRAQTTKKIEGLISEIDELKRKKSAGYASSSDAIILSGLQDNLQKEESNLFETDRKISGSKLDEAKTENKQLDEPDSNEGLENKIKDLEDKLGDKADKE